MSTLAPTDALGTNGTSSVPVHHPERWRLHRAGITNVWHYYDNTFSFSGGRMILRGTNGSGKSRAMEMLLPFLLDGDRRKMDSTGSGNVRMEVLMKAGGEGQPNRLGYLWLELERNAPHDTGMAEAVDEAVGEGRLEHLTIGALIRYSSSTHEAKVWYFTTPLRVGTDLILIDEHRQPLSRDKLAEAIGADNITDVARVHRDRVRTQVFGLTGQAGEERYAGLLQLLHTLRSPDVGNRIDEGNLPRILSDALPPLSEAALADAGTHLDALTEARAAQQRLETALAHVTTFLGTYQRYTATLLTATSENVSAVARAVTGADRTARSTAADRDRLGLEAAQAETQLAELEETAEDLRATIAAIKLSPAYAAGVSLDNLAGKVQALAAAARGRLDAADSARATETEAVARVDSAAGEVVAAALTAFAALTEARELLHQAQVPAGALPATIAAATSPGPVLIEPVRRTLDSDPEPLARPTPAELTSVPEDPTAAAAIAREVAATATARAATAGNRRATALRLAAEKVNVEKADAAAEQATARLEEELEDADRAAEERDNIARDLAGAWRSWVTDEVTDGLLGAVNWSTTAVGPLLVSLDALTGDPAHETATNAAAGDAAGDTPADGSGDRVDLGALDQAAQDAAGAARSRLADQVAQLDLTDRQDAESRPILRAEQDDLLAARDPEPPAAPWVRPAADGTPLWRCVDFADTVAEDDRAGLEAALLASGLLGATVNPDAGHLVAVDGQLLVSATGPVADRSLGALLRPDAASPVEADVVAAVLERIGLGIGHPTWVEVDGTWGNGPLTGRHTVAAARHIGAAARAARRAVRLEEIAAELAVLDDAAAARRTEREQVRDAQQRLRDHVRTAPASAGLVATRRLADAASTRVVRAEAEVEQRRRAAESLRTAWVRAQADHRSACDHTALPYEADALLEVRDRARSAATGCTKLADELSALARRGGDYERTRAAAEAPTRRRVEVEEQARADWSRWHTAAAELSTLEETMGAATEEVRERLADTEAELEKVKKQLDGSRKESSRLTRDAAVAAEQAAAAATKVDEEHGRLLEAFTELTARLELPGVAAAATGGDAEPLRRLVRDTLGDLTAAAAERVTAQVRAAVAGPGAPVEETALGRAQQTLERELSTSFDIIPTVTEGVRLVELTDAEGRYPIAEAATRLADKVDRARAALSDREHTVFTDFVIGGVGEELRRRLGQAEQLVAAMNNSLGGISTSHGIRVKLRWKLAEDVGSPVARIKELCATSAAIRAPHETDELVRLLKARVEEEYTLDPTAGYAHHLKNALDYRRWHRIDMVLTRPGQAGDAPVTRRTPLSQGERRFVSYVVLFAAVDAYLSGLPHAARALRLIILDDAFAKVDERTIAELLGLLVRLDLDFCMTGHALWGTFPEVPSLDVYEVRRVDGSSAITTHVHWDGKTRNMRVAR